jgi:DNA-binding transcriptional ArsR family regulator
MRANILGNTCIRINRDEQQITRCKTLLSELHRELSDVARVINLAGNEVRLKILLLINSEGRLCVCDLSDVLKMKISAVSQHLRKLRDTGLVTTQREGNVIYYQISDESRGTIEALLQLIPNQNLTFEI